MHIWPSGDLYLNVNPNYMTEPWGPHSILLNDLRLYLRRKSLEAMLFIIKLQYLAKV